MRQYVVDAFTDKIFSGNPAAVCIMENWIPEELMLSIAIENNLSETAFAVKNGDKYRLRWFSPGGEIDLCGHATLAAAYVIVNFVEKETHRITFETMSGELIVRRKGSMLELNFPAYELHPVHVTDELVKAVGAEPVRAFMGRDLLCVFEHEETVRALAPDMERLKGLEGLLLHATAQGTAYDCVSRSFAPKLNVAEDPVCGSGHCHIVPYWLEALKKSELTAYQASKRGGILHCRMLEGRVFLSGNAALYSVAELYI